MTIECNSRYQALDTDQNLNENKIESVSSGMEKQIATFKRHKIKRKKSTLIRKGNNNIIANSTNNSIKVKNYRIKSTLDSLKPIQGVNNKYKTNVKNNIISELFQDNINEHPKTDLYKIQEENKKHIKSHIKLLADSHGRELKQLINDNELSCNFDVYGIIKPNGKIRNVLNSFETDTKEMNKNDFAIIVAGTNDMNQQLMYLIFVKQQKRKLKLHLILTFYCQVYHIDMTIQILIRE